MSAGSVAEMEVAALVTTVAQGVKADARINVPKDTMALHDSIEVRRNNPLSARVTASAMNSSGQDYASYVELGARGRTPSLYMHRANQKWWPVFVAGMAAIGQGVLRGGVSTSDLASRQETDWSLGLDKHQRKTE